MHEKIILLLVAVSLIVPSSKVLCQNYITGITLNSDSNEPIQYANIFFKNKQQVGTLSERDGSFTLKISGDLVTDTIVFSILGYENKYIPVSAND